MSDRLLNAIQKLTVLRGASHSLLPGRWSNAEDRQEITGGHGAIGEFWMPEHADLVVTLHATIDAQIELLHLAISYGELKVGRGSRFIEAAHKLADAILDAPEGSQAQNTSN